MCASAGRPLISRKARGEEREGRWEIFSSASTPRRATDESPVRPVEGRHGHGGGPEDPLGGRPEGKSKSVTAPCEPQTTPSLRS